MIARAKLKRAVKRGDWIFVANEVFNNLGSLSLTYIKKLMVLAKDRGYNNIYLYIKHIFSYFNEELANELSSEASVVPSYAQYLRTLFKTHSKSTNLNYLLDITNTLQTPICHITSTEKKIVDSRKLWSDVVTDVHRLNAAQTNTKASIIQRLMQLGYTNNTDKIYHDCLHFLKYESALVISFNANFLVSQELTDYQYLNMFQRSSDHRNNDYKNVRIMTEEVLFKNIQKHLYQALMYDVNAKPRYAALILLDQNHTIDAVWYYGKSYVVLSDIVKYNSLYNPHDSINARYYLKQDIQPCSYHYFEILLLQCTDNLLHALANKSVTGEFPAGFSQNIPLSDKPNENGYVEALLPAIDLLDSNFVRHIHISKSEYTLSADELHMLHELGIKVSNGHDNPYKYPDAFIQPRGFY